jgi:hypothetical protein
LPANNCERTVSRSSDPANGRSLHRPEVPSTSRNATPPRYSERTVGRTSDTRPTALLVDRCDTLRRPGFCVWQDCRRQASNENLRMILSAATLPLSATIVIAVVPSVVAVMALIVAGKQQERTAA